jgi:hypothetical protein
MHARAVVVGVVVALGLAALRVSATPAAQAAASGGKVETYYYFVFTNPAPGAEEEYNRYYDTQHAADVVSIPGFVTAQRFVAADPPLRNSPVPSKYLIVYKVVTADLPAVQAEVVRRIRSGETVISPVMVSPPDTPSGYYKVISPLIPHKGPQPSPGQGKAETYYQFVFSNPTAGTSAAAFNKWYDEIHAGEVVSSPNWIEAERGQLMNPPTRPGRTTYNYVIAFKIVTGDLAATWEGYRQNAKAHPMTDGPLGENIGVTYKTLGPMLYGDHVRAARAKTGAAK